LLFLCDEISGETFAFISFRNSKIKVMNPVGTKKATV